MWILKGPNDESYYLLPGKHVVGRKNSNLVFANDQSISRTHGVIEVSHPQSNWGNPAEKPIALLTDAGSKYGTTLTTGKDIIKLEKNVKKNLKENDVIHFGMLHNKWRLTYEPLVVVVSSLPKAEKQKVRTIVGELGGHVVTEWHSQTSHLTMVAVTLTVKAITALALARPIVSPQYWTSLKTAVTSMGDLPKCGDYVPPVGESVLNEHDVSFLVNPNRTSLFSGKTFYFFSEPQFKDHGGMIRAAGGVAKLVRAVRHSQMKNFVDANAVALQLLSTNSQSLTPSQTPEAFTEVCDFVKSHGKRMIPASEIGLAVLHCSVEKYCNPDFSFTRMLLRNSKDSQPALQEKILATETQENSEISQPLVGERKVIPDSGCESKLELNVHGNTIDSGSQDTEALLQNTEQMTKGAAVVASGISQTQSQSESQSQGPSDTSVMARNSKRSRVIEESDDEVEILPPRKLLAAPAKQRHPVVISLEENSNDEAATSISSNFSSSRVSRLNTSRALNHSEDNDDPDQLFADFKESQPKTRKSTNVKRPKSPDMDADDLFADFKEDIKPSTVQKLIESNKPLQPSVKSSILRSPAFKRDLSDDENGPPEKRLAKLDLSKQHGEEETNNEREEEFMTTTQVKKEEKSLSVKPSCNVTIVFKPLMTSKSKNTSVASAESSLTSSDVVNYKKFRKVNPFSSSAIPRIIGGRDLQPYQSFCGNSSVFSDMNENADESEEEGPNTLWGAVTQRSSKFNRSRKL